MTDPKNEQNEKAVAEVQTESGFHDLQWIPDNVTTFVDLMALEEAQQQAREAANLVSQFKALVENIFSSEEVENKSQAVQSLAAEFATLIEQAPVDKEASPEHLHYKEVTAQAEKATDKDFNGGCERCGFGTKESIKDLEKCPYCWEPIV